LKQLKPGGRIIIPIGQPFKHNQVLYVYKMDKRGRVHSKKYIPVYFIPMKGTMGATSIQMGISQAGVKQAKTLKTRSLPDPAKRGMPTPSPTPQNKKAPLPYLRGRAIWVP
jgi:protein-L-isoaspartate(D-aspartate) O-methyltransferase